jgi:hypothetical protein
MEEVKSGFAALKGSSTVKIDDKYTDIPHHSYYAALNFCYKQGKRLCSRNEYCPDGVATYPKRGHLDGDRWAPVSDQFNNWIQLGNLYKKTKATEQGMKVCNFHTECCGSTPNWGQVGNANNGGQVVLCCQGGPDVHVQDQMMAPVTLTATEEKTFEGIKYWKDPLVVAATIQKFFPPEKDRTKYILFELDHGGFNNIRLAFETVVLVALVTGRTLVLPPATGWYLFDWGPMGTKENEKGVKDQISPGTLSEVGDYWDVDAMRKVLSGRCITVEEFIERERVRFKIPAKFTRDTVIGGVNGNEHSNAWIRWAMGHGVWANIGGVALDWPSVAAVAKAGKAGYRSLGSLSDGRSGWEYVQSGANGKLTHSQQLTRKFVAASIMYFPGDVNWPGVNSKWKAGTSVEGYDGKVVPEPPLGQEPDRGTYRYLSQFSTYARFDAEDKFAAVMKGFRDGVKYKPDVFKLAAKVRERTRGGSAFLFLSLGLSVEHAKMC